MNQDIGFDIWCGLDVGKQAHHACALDAAGRRVFDKPQDQKRLEELFDKLQTHGRVLVIVDQPNTIGALPIAVARSMGIQVAYLPGLAMRRAADLYPGNAKTDARDAFIIADAARTMPHTLRRVDAGEETLAELKVLVGFDEYLAAEATRLSNRIRGLLTQIHPALERVVGTRLTTKQGLAVIEQLGGPHGMAGVTLRVIAKAYPRGAQEFADASPPLWVSRPLLLRAPPRRSRCCRSWQRRCGRSWTSGPSSLSRSRKWLMLTLLPRS